ncbi:hypothetical protein [Chlamydiifrater volucris]|uniref:hypothetical protein n=1 Tax=Chlamydiifrater volucris TaxID=2681470 RepID=UPI001BD17D81|nr:hypothetical protein [Chlamydiifrater volucris]
MSIKVQSFVPLQSSEGFFSRVSSSWKHSMSAGARYDVGCAFGILGVVLFLTGTGLLHATRVPIPVFSESFFRWCCGIGIDPFCFSLVVLVMGAILLLCGLYLLPKLTAEFAI